jgi:N-methylhydantoinase A
MRTETARSLSRLRSEVTTDEIIAILSEMEAQVKASLSDEGIAASEIEVLFEIDVRYSGQAFEVPLTINPDQMRREGIDGIAARFDTEHLRLFTFNMDSEQELVNLRAIAMGRPLELPALQLPRGDGNPIAAKIRDHSLWMDGGPQDAAIYDRALLKAGDVIQGPAIVVEMDSTTLIETRHVARVDDFGNLLITPAQ